MSYKNREQEKKEFDSFFLTATIFKFRYYLVSLFVVSAIVSSIISLQIPNEYTASVNAVPSSSKGSLINDAISGLGSTLKEFGLTKFGKGSDTYEFVVILFSRSLKDSLIKEYDLFNHYELPDTAFNELYTIIESNFEIYYQKEGNYIISYTDEDPKKAASIANYSIKFANQIYQKIFQEEAEISLNYLEERLENIDLTVKNIRDSLSLFSKKNLIFSPEEQAMSVSSAYTELKSELMKQEIMLDIMQAKFGENDQNTLTQQRIVNQLRSKVDDSQYKKGFAGNFPLNELTEIGIEYMRLSSELEVFMKLKGLLLPMLEETKLDKNKNVKSLLIVDEAIPPNKKSGPKRSLIVAGSSFGAVVLMILAIVLWFSYKQFLNKYKNYIS